MQCVFAVSVWFGNMVVGNCGLVLHVAVRWLGGASMGSFVGVGD